MKKNVAVKPIIVTVTEAGIIIPDHSNEPAIHNNTPTLRGIVFALGSEVTEVEVEDEVLFFNHNRNKVNIDDEQVIIMPVTDIIGVLE